MSITALESRRTGLPLSLAYFSRKKSASSGMSVLRLRSGGT